MASIVLVNRFIFAIPLFSCKVTQAFCESSEIAIYSGSTSVAKFAFGPKL